VGKDDEDDGKGHEDEHRLGRTPLLWRTWEEDKGVKSENGSEYCYAYDLDGNSEFFLYSST
jgi:hypothetical protein